ncbi:HAD family hydrolase [Terriglobus roseus]|uniref:Haloacid dehalogenase superfamily, subfamily IA, variant 3 with third motif having DD or ED n=1 Tax=Terriglobus roseus TaxID=392734 RepID=A0A1G7EZ87_9BACT|nr:HAD family phosphatase [Terriglobus roseus]SDE68665.1 haloacid dehalogenase superfamily, subfamily IA, variant 3 with third motif having DD or ED [Terriglobus roseus]
MYEKPIHLVEGAFDAILFDCDGTLVESAPAWHLAITNALHPHSAPMPRDWYFARLGLSPADLMDDYEAAIGALNITREEFFNRCTTGYGEAAHALEEVTIVADVARAWQGKVPMAVVTNAQRVAVNGALTATGLISYFNTIVSIEDVRYGKPEPDIYLKAAELLNIAPARCLVLEDSNEGLTAAKRAGMQHIDIRNHWTPRWKRK